ncbi:MAG: penicillin-insensitive murein endopeptidase [Thiocapsa sp.]|jgi:penicillin-insensitive murein endopeptidase|nr:penicillin-insensitive murein endopeptidase [Thiocapsa sp.]MCG6898063.1 penicillin-insensitive murein endopeptidase [Thiocapsa sp.]
MSQACRSPVKRIAPGPWIAGILAWISASAVQATPWAEVAAPSGGPPRVIGAVSNGCIGGADALPETGPGYVSVRRYRNRHYGHPELIRFIEDLGRSQQRRSAQLVMIGDLSQPRGGRMPSSHRSHQNGLDVDIWFTLVGSAAAATRLMDNRSDPTSMVQPGGIFVSPHWGTDQQFLIETAARHPAVERIFVNPAIKRALCHDVKGDPDWLGKIRPWWGHDSHFHVRLTCPAGSPDCEAQPALGGGSGCGQELAWWFSEEARSPSKRGTDRTKPEPRAPAACMALLPG